MSFFKIKKEAKILWQLHVKIIIPNDDDSVNKSKSSNMRYDNNKMQDSWYWKLD